MNWYRHIKIAQIWNTGPQENVGTDFEKNLRNLYELEYKWSMMNMRPFTGLDRRRENIINNLRRNLNMAADYVKDVLAKVFEKWLRNHALLDPEAWATVRGGKVSEYTDDTIEMFSYVVDEYIDYSQKLEDPYWHQNGDEFTKRKERTLMHEALENIDNMPHFEQTMEGLLEGHKEMLGSELIDDGLEDISERFNKKFKDTEEADAFIDNLTLDEVDIESIAYFEDLDQLVEYIVEYGDGQAILIEFYQHLSFPKWYGYWKEQGIDETRATIERINEKLINADPENTQEFIGAVNMALNAAHQTGSMLDYVGQLTGAYSRKIKELLGDQSAGTQVPQWNEQLQGVGVQVGV